MADAPLTDEELNLILRDSAIADPKGTLTITVLAKELRLAWKQLGVAQAALEKCVCGTVICDTCESRNHVADEALKEIEGME